MVVRYILQPISEAPVGATGPIPPELARTAPKGFRYVLLPPEPASLETQRAQALAAADAAYTARMLEGFAVPDHPGERLQLRDDADKTNWLTLKDGCNDALAAGLGDQPCALPVRTAANAMLVMTWAEAAELMRGLRAWGAAMLGALWALKDAIAAANDTEALAAIDLEAGWPG